VQIIHTGEHIREWMPNGGCVDDDGEDDYNDDD
jgi:hypothetical protein